MNLFARLRNLIVVRILGVADTPARIAFGVFLGFFVAFTPTIGFQIVLYVAIATLLRANKVVGIPILFISNPFTAVPLYYFCWKVGAWVLHLGDPAHTLGEEQLGEHLAGPTPTTDDWTTLKFWEEALSQLLAMGGELWLGSVILGILSGVLGYFVTLYGVRAYRRRST